MFQISGSFHLIAAGKNLELFIIPHLDIKQGAGVLSNENIYSSVKLYY